MEEKEYLQTLGEQILNYMHVPMCWKKFRNTLTNRCRII